MLHRLLQGLCYLEMRQNWQQSLHKLWQVFDVLKSLRDVLELLFLLFEPLLELHNGHVTHLDFLHPIFLHLQLLHYFLCALIEHSGSFLLMQLNCVDELLPIVLNLLNPLHVLDNLAIDLRFVFLHPVLYLEFVLCKVFV